MSNLINPTVKRNSDGTVSVQYNNGKYTIVYRPQKQRDGSEISLDQLHPLFRQKVNRLFADLKKLLGENFYIQVNSTLRTRDEQLQLHKDDPKRAVYVSPHEYGVAIDISVVDKRTGSAVTSRSDIQKLLEQQAKQQDVYWGGWFVSMMKEPWHFQIQKDWQQQYKAL